MKDKIIISGAGLVGSLLAKFLRQKGFEVSVYEKRNGPGKAEVSDSRSINLALSHRGIRALKMAGVYDGIVPQLIEMKGRMMHDSKGGLTFQPYGREGEYINSISRAVLNEHLINEAEKAGVEFIFGARCHDIDPGKNQVIFDGNTTASADLIIGADGAFSTIRKRLQTTDRFNYKQHYIEHGYKELSIGPVNGDFGLEPNYLHIWPRGNYMLIALPNFDKTFTCTLFFPFDGDPSFETLRSGDDVETFFKEQFPDALQLIPDLALQFQINPTSSLITISCSPWHKNRTMVIGDAAHAIVPFYGQGMNAGFEDCRIFMEMAKQLNYDWDLVLPAFSKTRKKDADAISELALYNFIEMRDHVGQADFLKRKKLESQLQSNFPEEWVPLYSMVTFSDIPYSEALELGKLQRSALSDFLDTKKAENANVTEIIARFKSLKKAGQTTDQ